MDIWSDLLDEKEKDFERIIKERNLNRIHNNRFFKDLSFSECQKKGLHFIRFDNLSLKECEVLSENISLSDTYVFTEVMCLLIFYISNNNNITSKTFSTLFLMIKTAKKFWIDEICHWVDRQESEFEGEWSEGKDAIEWKSEILEFKDRFCALISDINEWKPLLDEIAETWHIVIDE